MTTPYLFVLVSFLASVVDASNFQAPPSIEHSLKASLSIRGGAGPLPVAATAKAATLLNFWNAGVITLSPKLGCKVYGVERSELMEYQVECFGATTLLSIAIISYCLLFRGTSVYRAVGIANIPFSIFHIKELLNDTPRELGIPIEPSLIGLGISLFSARALLTNASFSSGLLKFLALRSILSGIVLAVAPRIGGQAWGVVKHDADDVHFLMVKLQGFFGISLGILIGSLVVGADILTAIGYSWIPRLVAIVMINFITREVHKFDMARDPQYAWLLAMATFVFTLAG